MIISKKHKIGDLRFLKKSKVILEARKAYAAEFDYRAMRECVDEVIGEGNVRLMQEHMAASLRGRGNDGGEDDGIENRSF